MNGLKINCLYAHGCDTAKMLGLNGIFKLFLIGETSNQEEIKLAISKLDYFPELISIAKEKGKDIFSEEVAYNYWFKYHTKETLKKTFLLKEKVGLKPEAVNILLDSVISSGVIVDEKTVQIKRILFNGKFYFSENEIKPDLTSPLELKKWDIVSLHLGRIRQKISAIHEDLILEFNEKAVQEINKKILQIAP